MNDKKDSQISNLSAGSRWSTSMRGSAKSSTSSPDSSEVQSSLIKIVLLLLLWLTGGEGEMTRSFRLQLILLTRCNISLPC